MSNFLYQDSDFESTEAFHSAVGNNQKLYNSGTPLRTTLSESTEQIPLTTHNLTDIMQGALLYRSETSINDTVNRFLTTSFQGFATASGETMPFTAGRVPYIPGQTLDSISLSRLSPQAVEYGVAGAFGSIHPTDIDSIAGISSGGDPTLFAPAEFVQFGNGEIPVSNLVQLEGHGPGITLWSTAASAFAAMRAEALTTGFEEFTVSQGYRDLADQWVKYRAWKNGGNKAAYPGTSKHGWGIAVDFTQAFRYRYNWDQQQGLEWLTENAHKFGFVWPMWARPGGSYPEDWHWEYRAHLLPTS